MTTYEKLCALWNDGKFVCVGLDSELAKLPDHICNVKVLGLPRGRGYESQLYFNREIVEATGNIVAVYKLNLAFYLSYGPSGLTALRETVDYIHYNFPKVVVILDAKFGDIGNTNNGYVEFAFDFVDADALTVHCYLGQVANLPFTDNPDKMIFVLCRTSNEGANEFQNLELAQTDWAVGSVLYEEVAHRVNDAWNVAGNCGLVTGATAPVEIGHVRQYAPNIPLLIPGIGAQGGDLENSVANAATADGGFVVNSSRGIIFASSGEDFAEAALKETVILDHDIRKAYNAAMQKGDQK